MAQKNGKKRKSWFEQQAERFGSDFINTIRSDEAQKGAIKVFSDLAYGNVNIPNEGSYFLNQQFLDNCIVAANSKRVYYSYLFSGLNALTASDPAVGNDNNFQATYRIIRGNFEAYSIILNSLHMIRDSGNIQILYSLTNQLAPYKYIL